MTLLSNDAAGGREFGFMYRAKEKIIYDRISGAFPADTHIPFSVSIFSLSTRSNGGCCFPWL